MVYSDNSDDSQAKMQKALEDEQKKAKEEEERKKKEVEEEEKKRMEEEKARQARVQNTYTFTVLVKKA
ncbi:hypothetical protein NEUTE1DRAFT_134199 [Neurospora tetrasperma FGSC 2508]|uniref:Uncharacterized protein n=1 Tax=Neurospora tetrasperma (strain FGSC 2508 / ATCC MYA-4615 / P0657) TaxID=510951 RepID=F8MAM0_NEUT8|nr:uncharacterized protein NEUTE1DRAFT_134199 [Neurospora tetrasperma FGSC 2508]EGO60141.1 hypothetical protein NEUTE1DRAFT_134199 [Neurospora tetrasperma FGSC 2508]EGZ75906.1 hypothetical protein NEUTE2DRAFT_164717 [Neurospora tetrasperma FGSC 2509]